jgi:DNA replication and repair protein RecF
VRVAAARGAAFRCYARVDVDFAGGLVGVVGPNGAGKTSLIELIHFGCAGYSPRTATESQVVRFGSDVTRVEIDTVLRGGPVTTEVGFRPGEPKRVTVGGAPERSVAALLARFPVLVFTPDRLRLVQGPPALRRAWLDRALIRLWPALADVPAAYGRALVQRNHLLRRIRAGAASADGLDAWDGVLASAGAELVAARERLCSRLLPRLAVRLAELGGAPGEAPLKLAANHGGSELLAALSSGRRRDIDRGATGLGPHLDDVELREDGRDIRRFGSQGEQRRMLLGLILAEADLLSEERDELPLLLLDDVTGEFDAERRGLLLDAVARFDQAILTSTDEADLGGRATAVVRVSDGVARAA